MILRNDYGDLENGFVLEIMITNHCNLNCMGCDHYAPVSKPFYMSYEELEKSLSILKKQGMDKYIKEFFLLGGEPFLNKNLISYLPLIKKYFPSSNIDVITNGSLIHKLSKNDLNTIKATSTHISVTKYPVQIDYQNAENILKNNNIRWRYLATRALFQQSLIDINGQGKAKNNFEKCVRHKFPCFTLQDYKIFFCPDACCLPHIKNLEIKNSEDDYLDINTITFKKIQDFCQKEKSICAYCKNDSMQALLWHKHIGLKEYYYTLKDYFLYDYENYLKIINNSQLANYFFNDNIESIDYVYRTRDLYNLLYQYKYSKIDIIIPFYNVNQQIMEQLKEELLKQTLIKECVIYFVSDNSPYAEKMFDFFSEIEQLNCIFLKNQKRQGPGVARNMGLKYSHGQYVFFLDVDDGFFNPQDLQIMYDEISMEDNDILLFPNCLPENPEKEMGTKIVVKRKYIEDNKIFFPSLYINEDYCFLEYLSLFHPKGKKSKKVAYKYNQASYKGSIGSTLHSIYPCTILALAGLYLQLKNSKVNSQQLKEVKNEFFITCAYYKNFIHEKFTKQYGLDLMQYLINELFGILQIKDKEELKVRVENILKVEEDFTIQAAYNFYLQMKGEN